MIPIPTRQLLTYLFVFLAIIAAIASLLLLNSMVKALSEEERDKLELWAMATESVPREEEGRDMSLVLEIIQGNNTIPLILYDEQSGRIYSHNIPIPQGDRDAFLKEKMRQFESRYPPIKLDELNQLLYYDDSYLLKQLQIYPYLQLLVIALFIGLAFLALNRSQRAEQNRVWVGLSKETAHQLGTPITSLMAWIEYLRMREMDPSILAEIEKDTTRLQVIAERFSKIGSAPDMEPADLREVVHNSLSYLERRLSDKVIFTVQFPLHPVVVPLNEALFGWVIENLTRNAVDAMEGEGQILFTMIENGKELILDVTDSGRGVPASKFRLLFSPGYTTKERGWGLGLTLVKRIVEVNHKGSIFVKRSEIGKGTTFRIVLRR